MVKSNCAINFTIQQLISANVHLGHRSSRVDSRIFEFLIGARFDIYLINLVKSVRALKPAISVLVRVIARRGRVLFANLEPQFVARFSREVRHFCYRYFFVNRKLPGILTNFIWLRQFYKGLRVSNQIPSYCIVTSSYDHHAVREADHLNLPSFGVFDSDTNPYGQAFYAVPGNDDSFSSRLLYYKLAFRAIKIGFRYYVAQWNLKRRSYLKGKLNSFSRYLFSIRYFKADLSNSYTYIVKLARRIFGFFSVIYFPNEIELHTDLLSKFGNPLIDNRSGVINLKASMDYVIKESFCSTNVLLKDDGTRSWASFKSDPLRIALIDCFGLDQSTSVVVGSDNLYLNIMQNVLISLVELRWARIGGEIKFDNVDWFGESVRTIELDTGGVLRDTWLNDISLRSFNLRRSKAFKNNYLLVTAMTRSKLDDLTFRRLRHLFLQKILQDGMVYIPTVNKDENKPFDFIINEVKKEPKPKPRTRKAEKRAARAKEEMLARITKFNRTKSFLFRTVARYNRRKYKV